MKRHIPNFLTSCNLFSGCVGIVFCFSDRLLWACWAIVLAALFDFLDGFVARLLGVSSPIGKELDSLADCVTFGVLPATIIFVLLKGLTPDPYLPFSAFLLAVFSALRLAKFNIDTRQSDAFIGVPTPANALLIGSLPLIMTHQAEFAPYFLRLEVLLPFIVLMSYLLVAELPLFALKFKNYAWAGNQIRYIFLLLALLLLLSLQYLAVPIVIALYVVLSGLEKFVFQKP
ncbi:CDP-diacylglycerol--serine O-phosphatidyltransferase [Hugenholtzia roseola]|uniref:CDP-diacylglycerol--serine O-phosphatidyltransferase n=1 Tax=Hugenholtzia roseola TaxID=1002 RepID=UPI0005547C82|nr:CDP-diacylglycerol--serine O-phosphatidyltransferase [Hugenholtzia roseola]